MTFAGLLVILVKVVIVIGFIFTMAALGAWADRRQSALLQHRVGPNRAVIMLPANLARVVMFGGAALTAAAISIPFWRYAPGTGLARTTTGIELAILVGWLGLLVLSAHVRKHGADNAFEEWVATPDPRVFFYAGLSLHLLGLLVVRVLPPALYNLHDVRWAPGLAGSVAAAMLMGAALYAAAKVPDGKVAVRAAGTLHAIADAIKMLWKEDLRPRGSDKVLFALAPLLAIFPALVTFAVIPFGNTLCFVDKVNPGQLDFSDLLGLANTVPYGGQCAAGQLAVPLQVADLNVGLLYVFAIAGTGIIGAALAGWSTNSNFSLLGGLRAASQMVS